MAISKYKLQVNSSKVSWTHTDYPAYVDLWNMPASFWSKVSNGGWDIRCYSDEALTTELAREVVSCDTATDTGELHVKTGLSTSTEIYITVDGTSTEPATSSTYGKNNVWSDYICVLHLQNSGEDSAGNTTPTLTGSDIASQIGKGRSFTAETKLPISDSYNAGNTDITVQLWLKTSDTGTNKYLFGGARTGPKIQFTENILGNNKLNMYSSTSGVRINSTTSVNDGIRRLVHYIDEGTTMRICVNGSQEASGNAGSVTYNNWLLMVNGDSVDNGLAGEYDEVRVRLSALSSDWRSTEYNNQSDVDTFWTISDVVETTNTGAFLLMMM